jgi:murein DD-endopeptidase MepM/ murein hydrolase activator NlpD
VPALLLTVASAALGGLALLPAQSAPAQAVLVSSPAVNPLHDGTERAAVLGRPPVRRTAVPKAAAVKKAVAPRPAAKRATRTRVLEQISVDGHVCPVPGKRHFSDDYGDARAGHRHQGNDIMAPYGAPVVAVISGVIKTDYSSAGGISIYLRGSDGDEYFYAHNSRNVVTTGQHVSTGEVIGYVGTSGNAPKSAPHVHFERHPNGGAAVNPYPFLIRVC